MNSLEFRFLHSVPAFLVALLVGALVLGLLFGIGFATTANEFVVLFGAPLLFLFVSPLYALVLSLGFFSVVGALRIMRLVLWPVFTAVGALFGLALSFVEEPSFPIWAVMVAGATGGYAAFVVIRLCARRDAICT